MAQTLKDEVRQAILEAAMDAMLENGTCDINTVSYTHLDVYKRQQ